LIKVDLNPNQIIALVSFTYNNGLKAFEDSTLLKRLNAGEDPNQVVDEEFPKWRCTTLPTGEKKIS
jgi:lysozyme